MMERRKSTFVPFKAGDKVWLDTRNLKTNHHKKIGPKRKGPFEITKVIGPITYQLQLPKTWKIHNVFHATLLRQYKETEVYGANFTKPPPDLIKREEVYKVESILKPTENHWKVTRTTMSQSNHSSPSSSSEDYQTPDSSYLVETTVYELSRIVF